MLVIPLLGLHAAARVVLLERLLREGRVGDGGGDREEREGHEGDEEEGEAGLHGGGRSGDRERGKVEDEKAGEKKGGDGEQVACTERGFRGTEERGLYTEGGPIASRQLRGKARAAGSDDALCLVGATNGGGRAQRGR